MGAVNSLKNIYLVISQGCNISCTYCYAKGGDFGKGLMLMSRATMEKALERLLPLSDGRCNISFFGGEPLLNFDLMKETVAYGKRLSGELGIELTYSITTNGTILNEEILAFFRKHITYTSVSLDGGPMANDTHRVSSDGGGTHALITENLKRFKDAGIPFGINATVSPETVHNLQVAVEYLNDLGARNLRVVPVIPQGSGRWRGEPLNRLLKGLTAVYKESINRLLDGKKPLLAEHLYKIVSNLATSKKRSLPCAAGEGIVAVAANGDVYPCDHFVGIEEFRMGNVFDDGIFSDERFYRVRNAVSKNSVEQREKCRECFAKDICGGECHARSFMLTGDISTPSHDHCALIKEMVREITPIVVKSFESEEKRKKLLSFIGMSSTNLRKQEVK